MENSRLKEIIILLVVLALIGGFILFMRSQSLKKELQAEKDKMELAARRQAEEKEREERRLAEEKEREERRLAEEKEREERRLAEEKRREAEASAREKEAELRKHEAGVREKRQRIAQLKKRLNDLEKMPGSFSAESRRVADEIAALDDLRKDDRYKCFDFCINFRDIKFERPMRRDRDEPDLKGYYSVLVRGDRGKRVKVSYHCNEHGITWTKKTADSYRQKYIPSTRIEEKRKQLVAKLNQIRRNENAIRAAEAAKLRSELSAAEKELAEMEKAQPGVN